MLEIEYRCVEYNAGATLKDKREIEHKEAYLLLNQMLRKHFNIDNPKILKDENGKPYIKVENVFFSLSHTDGMVCCAVSDLPCGIDCERLDVRDNTERLSKRYFTEGELALMEGANYSSEEFLKIWTCKEAVGKRLGCGFILAHKIDTTKENCKTIIENGYIISVNI